VTDYATQAQRELTHQQGLFFAAHNQKIDPIADFSSGGSDSDNQSRMIASAKLAIDDWQQFGLAALFRASIGRTYPRMVSLAFVKRFVRMEGPPGPVLGPRVSIPELLDHVQALADEVAFAQTITPALPKNL
jgi:hypothetical protein